MDRDSLPQEMALEAPSKGVPAKGVISFKVVWQPNQVLAIAPRPRLPPELRLGCTGILRVHLERGENLIPMDW